MNQAAATAAACHSVFRQGAETTTSESYTKLWIELINQIERDKAVLSG